ncbi:MAG: calcium-binding protein [Nocardioides sp.]
MLIARAPISRVLGVLVVVGVLVPAGPAGPAGAGEPVTCQGRVATLVGTDGPDVLTGTDGPDVVAGLGGDDRIEGLGGADVLCGGPGADSLDGGGGDDALDAGYDASALPRRDQLRWHGAGRGVTIDLGDGLTGTATGQGHDTFVLDGGPVVVGSPYADTVKGSPLRDRIHPARGSDTVYAGPGDDLVVADAGRDDPHGADLVQTGAGEDRVTVLSGHDRVLLGAGADSVEGFGAAGLVVEGQGGDDNVLVALADGGPAADLAGGPGRDWLFLTTRLQSRRTVLVDAGAGLLRGPGRGVGRIGGFERFGLIGTARWDFRGTRGPDHVQAAGYESVLVAHTNAGDDLVEGSEHADLVDAGAGHDRVLAHGGRDRCLHAEVRRSCEVTH